MEKETRVEKYKKLREEINDMDNNKHENPYSVDNGEETHEVGMTEEEIQQEHVKKNTLSISIDQIMKAHDEYTTMISQDELEKEKKQTDRLKRRKILLYGGIIGGIVLVLVLLIVLICVVAAK